MNKDGSSVTNTTVPTSRQWVKILAQYKTPHHGRSFFEIAVTIGSFLACWVAMWFALDVSVWLYLLLVLPAAGLLVRIFLIQHDCGHGAFFRSRVVNDWVGRVFGILTLVPYDYWKRTHAIHHASSGNLDRRGMGDIDTLTLNEYQALTPLRKLGYRLYRNPFVMFLIGPTHHFFLQHRLPIGLMRRGWGPWASTMSTNIGIVAFAALGMWLVGVGDFLLIQIPTTVLATTIGVWLFFVQHQFDETYWNREEDWNRHDAAFHGSSHYDLPPVLRWFTANIGVHHVHHLSSAIPFYRLTKILRDYPELKEAGRLTLWQSFRCVPLALWDEEARKLISFRELRKRSIA
ncbi:fatty acid desaturase [Cohaesibacter celericrescens]|uniref:Fatty acid desaturase n=1 Tax=Cohaesibacter celericrescens TaxID=2067669 RepID=A0A2N5XX13_9HYPH|nr:fatty acid desaturase [Cohaesibacter celericrescens]PLW79029.1 fatty acid desaturase [Cohaesibacter celericrescens]